MKMTRWWHSPWCIFMIAVLGIPYQFFLQTAPSVMAGRLLSECHWQPSQLGWVTSSFFYTYVLFQIPAGILIDRIGVRLVLWVGMVCCSLGCLLFATSHAIGPMIWGRLLMGAASAGFVPGAMVVASQWFSPARFALLAGLAESIGMLGGGVGQAVLSDVIDHVGWRVGLNACVLLGVLIAVAMYVVVQERAIIKNEVADRSLVSTPPFYRNGGLWLISLFSGLVFAPLAAFAGLWAVPFLQSVYGFSGIHAALGSAMIYVGVAVAAPMSSRLFVRSRRPKLFLLVMVSVALLLFFMIVSPWMNGMMMMASLFLFGVFCSVYVAGFVMARLYVPPRYRATALAMVNMFCLMIGAPLLQPYIGYQLAPAAVSVIATHVSMVVLQSYHHALMVIVWALIVALSSVFMLPTRRCFQST